MSNVKFLQVCEDVYVKPLKNSFLFRKVKRQENPERSEWKIIDSPEFPVGRGRGKFTGRKNVWYLISKEQGTRPIIGVGGLLPRRRPFRHRLTTERKQEIVLEMTCPPTNPIWSRSLVNYPRGNSSRELVGKFDLAVMTIPWHWASLRRNFRDKARWHILQTESACPSSSETFLLKW